MIALSIEGLPFESKDLCTSSNVSLPPTCTKSPQWLVSPHFILEPVEASDIEVLAIIPLNTCIAPFSTPSASKNILCTKTSLFVNKGFEALIPLSRVAPDNSSFSKVIVRFWALIVSKVLSSVSVPVLAKVITWLLLEKAEIIKILWLSPLPKFAPLVRTIFTLSPSLKPASTKSTSSLPSYNPVVAAVNVAPLWLPLKV